MGLTRWYIHTTSPTIAIPMLLVSQSHYHAMVESYRETATRSEVLSPPFPPGKHKVGDPTDSDPSTNIYAASLLYYNNM